MIFGIDSFKPLKDLSDDELEKLWGEILRNRDPVTIAQGMNGELSYAEAFGEAGMEIYLAKMSREHLRGEK
jgi:hypothetical protein